MLVFGVEIVMNDGWEAVVVATLLGCLRRESEVRYVMARNLFLVKRSLA